ncbi:MAG: caspase family protein [Calditrichaeota bacterium]|nr:caspase family protein [Calditrichota bacterium]
MRNTTVIVLLSVFTVSVAAHAATPHRYAVVIGINDYADPAIPDLKYAENDAKAIYATLTDPDIGRFPKGNVTMLLGSQATPSNIKAALWKLRGVGKNDVVIFYSGHGAKEGNEAFWVTQNAQISALPATALSNTDIRKYLKIIPSQKLVTFLDCCYAASTVKKSLSDPTKLFGEFAGKGRVTIAGSADNQEAMEMPAAKSGVFTHFLVQALDGKADANEDGVVTFEEVWRYLGNHVRKASVAQGGLHEPVIITESGVTPQFLLTFNPTAKAANDKALITLRKLFAADKITGEQYDTGRAALTSPAIGLEAQARREVFADLAAGKLDPKYLAYVLSERIKSARRASAVPPSTSGKPTLAVVPFDVLGSVRVKDAGKILAERLLPMFSEKYQLIDQSQLARFLEQDDLTIAGLVEHLNRPRSKGLSKAVRMRAVRYLVVGTISGLPDGSLSVTARLSDWQSGSVVRIAQVRADSWQALEACTASLASKLLGDEQSPPLESFTDKEYQRVLGQAQQIVDELRKDVEDLGQ